LSKGQPAFKASLSRSSGNAISSWTPGPLPWHTRQTDESTDVHHNQNEGLYDDPLVSAGCTAGVIASNTANESGA